MEVKSTSQKDAKIQSYSLDFKFSVIEHAEKHGNSNTAKKFSIAWKKVGVEVEKRLEWK